MSKRKRGDSSGRYYSRYLHSLERGRISNFHLFAEEEIKELVKDGMTDHEIAEELGVQVQVVGDVRRRLKRKQKEP